mgnify:CR=1 FL=1
MTELSSAEMSEFSGGNEALLDAAQCYGSGAGYVAAAGLTGTIAPPVFAAITIGVVVACADAAY